VFTLRGIHATSPQTTTSFRLGVDPRFQTRERQPGLDLLRALAIVVVVIYHAGIIGFPLPGRVHRFGWIGVDLFFVLSGYLIGGQLLASLARERAINLGRFFARRALRILPAYLVVLAIYIFLPLWRECPEMTPWWKFLISVQNIGLHGGTAFSHAWSLAVEDQFYLCLPFILLFVNRRPRAAFVIPWAIVLGGIALRAWLAQKHPGEIAGTVSFRGFQVWIYYPTWTRLDPLVFGVALAAIEKFRPQWWQRLMDSANWLWLPAVALILCALWLGEGEYLTVAASVWQFPLIALGMAALLVCAVSPRFRRATVPGAAFIASIAYSVYLVQKLVINFVAQFCSSHNIALTSIPMLILVEVCVYAAGTILFFAIERPFLQLRHRIAPRRYLSPE
jgi:peptidoglycan/LPS O-acetylase OafA/YrhL